MRGIREQREFLGKVLKDQRVIQDSVYRRSVFCVEGAGNGGILLHNTLTGELLWFRDEAEIEENREKLIQRYYYVPEDFDEKKLVFQLRSLSRMLDDTGVIHGYTIFTTTQCNARCAYCFEKDAAKYPMTEETAHAAVDYICRHSGNQPISLFWFGGEPLLNTDRIDQISRELSQRGVKFISTITTNGSLFNGENIRRAVELWQLQSAQITLDGTEAVYNRIKAYPGFKGSPYQQVLRNIDLLCDAGIKVTVRMNMDTENAADLDRLADELTERYRNNRNFQMYVALIYQDKSPEERIRKRQLFVKMDRKLKDLGIGGYYIKLSHLKGSYCIADGVNTAVITPDGKIAKCEQIFEEKTIGSIFDDHIDRAVAEEWRQAQFDEICCSCPLMPSCIVLKGCPVAKICDEQEKQRRIDGLKETMQIISEGRKFRVTEESC